jgi:hypothetical protein
MSVRLAPILSKGSGLWRFHVQLSNSFVFPITVIPPSAIFARKFVPQTQVNMAVSAVFQPLVKYAIVQIIIPYVFCFVKRAAFQFRKYKLSQLE